MVDYDLCWERRGPNHHGIFIETKRFGKTLRLLDIILVCAGWSFMITCRHALFLLTNCIATVDSITTFESKTSRKYCSCGPHGGVRGWTKLLCAWVDLYD